MAQGSELFDPNIAASPPVNETIELLGVPIMAATEAAAIDVILAALEKPRTTRVAFFNSNLAISLERLGGMHRCLEGFLILNDGLATDMASLLTRRRRFPANLNGTDLTPALLARLPRGTRVFLYGATRSVVERYADHVQTQYGLHVCGVADGYRSDPDNVLRAAIAAEPDVILVALGNPRQELWIRQYPERSQATLLLGVGALFDFTTTEQKRAPLIVRRLRAEWLYRLAQDPRRLGRRYTIDMAEFFWRVWRYERRRTGSAGAH